MTYLALWLVADVLLLVTMVISANDIGKGFWHTVGRLYLVTIGLTLLAIGEWAYMIGAPEAAVTLGLLSFSALVLIAANFKVSKIATALLIPYFLWTVYATVTMAQFAYTESKIKLEDGLSDVQETVPVVPEQPGTLTLYVGVTKAIDRQATIVLDRVDDSRCPADVQCIWAGELSPVFTVTVDGVKTELRLGTMTTQKGGVMGYHFTLLDAGIDFAKVSVEK